MRQITIENEGGSITHQPHLEALRVQRRGLMEQLNALRSEESAVRAQFDQLPPTNPARNTLDIRMIELNERAEAVERMLNRTANDIAELGVQPGILVPPPEMIHIERENLLIGGLFTLLILLPISIAFARRIWRRGTTAVATLPSDLMDRLNRMESAVDATAIEVERIGEGQRFLTKLMSDHLTALSENTSRAGFLERAKERAAHSGTTPH